LEAEPKAEASACQQAFPVGSLRATPASAGAGALGLRERLDRDEVWSGGFFYGRSLLLRLEGTRWAVEAGRAGAPSSDPHNVLSYHSTEQRLDVLHDSRPSAVVIGSQTINQLSKRAWRIETPPDVIADIIQAEIAAAFDAHHQNFAVHLR